jgi:hypothetical protein
MRPFPPRGLKYFLAQRLTLYSLVAGAVMCDGGCANVASIPSAPLGPQAISVTVTPSSGSVMLGNQFPFTAAVKNSSDSTVTWSVNGVTGVPRKREQSALVCLYRTWGLGDPREPDGNGDQPRGREQIRDGNCHGAE